MDMRHRALGDGWRERAASRLRAFLTHLLLAWELESLPHYAAYSLQQRILSRTCRPTSHSRDGFDGLVPSWVSLSH